MPYPQPRLAQSPTPAIRNGCSHCRHRQSCLPRGLDDGDTAILESAIQQSTTLPPGHSIFRQGERFASLFMVRSGSIKACRYLPEGREQVVGFYLSGDLLGLESLHPGIHLLEAVTLESASLCRLDLNRLGRLQGIAASLQARLLGLASRELGRQTLPRDPERCAESRMAEFLLTHGERLAERGCSSRHYHLTMSRRDIGSYLGMAPETVSRSLRRLMQMDLVRLERRRVEIRRPEPLRMVAEVGLAAIH